MSELMQANEAGRCNGGTGIQSGTRTHNAGLTIWGLSRGAATRVHKWHPHSSAHRTSVHANKTRISIYRPSTAWRLVNAEQTCRGLHSVSESAANRPSGSSTCMSSSSS